MQKRESGAVTTPRGIYIRALEFALGEPIENLGFVPADEKYSLDREVAMTTEAIRAPDPKTAQGPLNGLWRSRYEYVSSGSGGQTFTDEHYVLLIQHGAITQNGAVITGSWSERTNPSGYYQDSVYHGAVIRLATAGRPRLR